MSETKNNLEQPLFQNVLNLNSQGKQGLQTSLSEGSGQGLTEQASTSQNNKNIGAEFNLNNFQNLKTEEQIFGNEDNTQNNGSNNNLGKFKNSDSLLQSYNLLQSDYTKKCQALKELQKQVEEEKTLKEKELKQKEEFENNATKFFEENPKAKKYENTLKQIILKDKELGLSNTPFESAWFKFLQDNFFSAEELISDENFLKNYIFNNEKIKSQILSNYFSTLKINSSPVLISNQRGNKTVLSPQTKPKNISQAGKLAEELFLN